MENSCSLDLNFSTRIIRMRKAVAKISKVKLQLVPQPLISCLCSQAYQLIPRMLSSKWQPTLIYKTRVHPIILCIYRSQRCSSRKVPSYRRVVHAPHSSIMPKHLGQVRIAGVSEVAPCFPAQVYTGRWAMSRLRSNPSALWLEMQLPHFHFCLVLFSEVKHWAEHQTCPQSWCGTSPSKHCWHSWNLPDGRREASEKPQIQTSCFPFVTPGIQKQVNKTLRWKSTQLYLLIWPQALSHLPSHFLSALSRLLQAVKDLWLFKVDKTEMPAS